MAPSCLAVVGEGLGSIEELEQEVNQVVELQRSSIVADTGRMSVTDVLRHVSSVQEVMRAVMKPEVHYGRIPGAGEKPTLFKQGAEVLCLAFKIGDEYRIEDLSTADVARYRVTCSGIHQSTGVVLGQGVGECSSAEEKYKWRKAVCKEEFEATPANMRRIKFGKKSGGHYTVEQVRTESADVANTVLKMASKRAKIGMTLNVTAASDMFGQDLEDLDAALREHLTEDEQAEQANTARAEWVAKATAAKTEEELRAVMQAGVKVFQAARDKDGYSMFAAAIQQRGAALKNPAAGAPDA
jgi:hypothetical protein